MHFDLGSIYSSYALGNLSASEFSRLASGSAFIFTDIKLDHEFIRRNLIGLGLWVYADH